MSYRAQLAAAIKIDDMEAIYALALECALIADKKSVQQAIGNKEPYSSFFDEAWALYPKRSGSNSKREAWGAWQARLRSKSLIAPIDMIQGVKRYAAWCQATGKVGTETVMQARRFFGPALPFKESWEVGQVTSPDASPSGRPDFKYICGIIEGRKQRRDGEVWWEAVQQAAKEHGAANYRDTLLYAYRHV